MPGRKSFRAARTVRNEIALTWAGTTWSQPLNVSGDVIAIDISTSLTDRLERQLTNGVLQTVRGQLGIGVNPTSQNVQTTAIVSCGIVWADSAFIDPTGVGITSSALFPNPLQESMKWIWRKNIVVEQVFPTDAPGQSPEWGAGQIEIHVKSKRKQPSLQHKLYFFIAMDPTIQANLDSVTPIQHIGAVNVLMKTP